MTRLTVAVTSALLLSSQPSGLAQLEPRFDVVSIKRDTSGNRALLVGTVPSAAFSAAGATAAFLIRYAYPADDRMIANLPSWASSDRFVILGKAAGTPTAAQVRAMVADVLARRFGLQMHFEARDEDVYALVVANPGQGPKPAFRKTALDCRAITEASREGRPVPETANGAPPCGMRSSGGVMDVGGLDIATIASTLRSAAGRPVVDRTGLSGEYEFTLTYSASASVSGAPSDAPSIFTALEEQLGLKLEPQRAPVRHVVVDHLEPPTPD
ncbi:MAG TPA: TIGR03435 family protein [Vicinamibacterales bacterium]|nr:TIGR03435 family protein [Vicinamibacterales bacterium]